MFQMFLVLQDTKDKKDKELLYTNIAKKYKECMNDMAGRAPGLP
jgi:hypothetical protein